MDPTTEPLEQNCEFDFETTFFCNTLTVKYFSSKQTGLLKSRKFFGTSALSSQVVSWYYLIQPNVTQANQNEVLTVIEVFIDPICVIKSQLHGEIVFSNQSVPKIKRSGRIIAGSRVGEAMTIYRSTLLNNLVKDDILTLRFEFSMHEEIQHGPPVQCPVPLPDPQLNNHFENLLESTKFTDFSIVTGKQKFLVHKAILSARSPVFGAMFEHKMQESQKNSVTIEDIEPRVFQEVLRFIYTGTVKEMEQMPGELLAAADKYALDRLKTLCEEYMGAVLTVETAAKTLCLADMYHAQQLKQQAIQFISQNIKHIQTEDWKGIIANNTDVAAEMFAEMAKLN